MDGGSILICHYKEKIYHFYHFLVLKSWCYYFRNYPVCAIVSVIILDLEFCF
uniref:Uncharacterized protein n=1 Tax=Arundo donax TaxID=35708 RepID=A0A0A8Y1I5_ARUDO